MTNILNTFSALSNNADNEGFGIDLLFYLHVFFFYLPYT